MEPIDSSESGAIGWHLIARGGDMTARVHPAMRLGVLPSGDISFESPDAVVQLDLAGEALTLAVVAEDYELELEAGERTRAVRVGRQTHISLDFLGHTLDIDNDFAAARPSGDALALSVVRKDEPRQALRPLRASAREAEIVVAERADVAPLKAVPVDYLQREHAAASADKRQALAQRSNVRRIILALAGSVLVVAALVVTALYVASRSVEEAMTADRIGAEVDGAEVDGVFGAAADESAASVPGVENADVSPGTESLSAPATPAVVIQPAPGTAGVSQDVLVRLSALLEAEPLPDKATIDFAVESLRSLMTAYPDDPRIPAALASLNERLVQEARLSYDEGDAFRAGRLIEQATMLGLAGASVAATLDYFASRPPGTAAVSQTDSSQDSRTSAPTAEQETPTAEPEPVVSDAEAEAMLIEAVAQEEAAVLDTDEATTAVLSGAEADGVPADDPSGLDSLVESATGLALGALAVEVIVEDVDPGQTAVGTDPVLEALGPALPLAADASGVDSTVQLALDAYLAASVGADAAAVSANELPDGFVVDEVPTGINAADPEQLPPPADVQSPPSGPRFQPYSELKPVRQAPLQYPSRALEGSEGSIDVEFTVTETGRVIDVSVTGEAPAIFLREAARTIRNWRFVPVRQDGEAVPVRTTLRVTYRS